MSPMCCAECRKPVASLGLFAKGGYADGPRPVCSPCFNASRYLQLRFSAVPLGWCKPAKWMDQWRDGPPAPAVTQEGK